MMITAMPVEAQKFDGLKGVDPVIAYWGDVSPGAGYVTLICYGRAWTAYFGAMGSHTIRDFFCRADTDYMVTKMYAPTLKEGRKYEKQLGQIIDAVKDAMRECVNPL